MAQLPESRIERSSPVPYYFQLKKLLEEEIVSGRWQPGDRFPSEPAMCAHFDISRSTVRQALAELESEGLIRKEKGRGSFVARPQPSSWLLQSTHGFYDDAVREGRKVTSRVLRREIQPLPPWALDALELPPGASGVALERLRWVDDQLVMYVITHLPMRLADTVLAADLEGGSLYHTLEEQEGITVGGGYRLVEAVVARDDLAPLLEVERGAALLFVESVSWTADRRPFECYRAWHRADRTKVEVQTVPHGALSQSGLVPKTEERNRR
jgi:GntR family transcriptional regulator